MNFWLILGFTGQLIFGLRFVIQWICSERKKESYIPIAFWYCSIVGGIILFIYAVSIKDPVFILGQSMGVIIYTRNLILIRNKRLKEGPPPAMPPASMGL